MTMTKVDCRGFIQNHIDEAGSSFYSASWLDILITATMDELWAKLLTFSPFYLSTLETISAAPKLVSPGYIDINQLAKRFYKLQSLVRDGVSYTEQRPRNVQLDANAITVGDDYRYVYYGDQIWLFPLSASQSLEFRYSYLPTRFSSLADGTNITWPDGFEMALCFEVASRALTKGDREENARVAQLARNSWDGLLDAVRRNRAPVVMYDYKTPQDFAGI